VTRSVRVPQSKWLTNDLGVSVFVHVVEDGERVYYYISEGGRFFVDGIKSLRLVFTKEIESPSQIDFVGVGKDQSFSVLRPDGTVVKVLANASGEILL